MTMQRATADTATDADTIHLVTINVTDVNEDPVFADTSTPTRTIPENTDAGHPIGDPVEAADPENDTLTYTHWVGRMLPRSTSTRQTAS